MNNSSDNKLMIIYWHCVITNVFINIIVAYYTLVLDLRLTKVHTTVQLL